jgi:PAT family beta-lactamase induction signal transducer AmpG
MTASSTDDKPAPPKKKYGLRETIAAMGNPRVASMAALGFSSGLPFMLTGATFGYWLGDANTKLTAIGFLSWVGLAYTFKVFWAPAVDKVKLPVLGKLGQRRSWAILVQVLIAIGLVAMAMVGPSVGIESGLATGPAVVPPAGVAAAAPAEPMIGGAQLAILGAFALLVAFASATQDIAIDAWRIESANDSDELGLFTAAYQLGYRVALLVSDALILFFANHMGWPISYTIMAALMAVGLAATWFTPEPKRGVAPQTAAAQSAATGGASVEASQKAAGFFLLAAILCWVLPLLSGLKWLETFAIGGRHSQFGDVFSAIFALLAAGAFFRIRYTWIAGAAAIGVIVLVAFYGAITGADFIGGAPLFWPTMFCIAGSAMAAPPRIFDAFLGPLVEFMNHHGVKSAILILAMISVYRLPEFVIGPVAGPFYGDLGLSKDVVGGVRASVGAVGSFAGIIAGGVAVAALGFSRTLLIGAALQGLGVASYALLAFYGPSIGLFSFAMAADNFCYAFAGVALITYMSSLVSVGYTATQYALMSSLYTLFGKVLKGFSGAVVDGFQVSGRTLMESYGLFYIGAGLIAAPAMILCVVLLARQGKTKPEPSVLPTG